MKGERCWQKNRYSSLWTAKAVAQAAQERAADSSIEPYYCRACSCYHIGHALGDLRRLKAPHERPR